MVWYDVGYGGIVHCAEKGRCLVKLQVVVSGRERCLMVQAVAGVMLLPVGNVVGRMIDTVDAAWLEASYGPVLAGQVLELLGELGSVELRKVMSEKRKG